MNAARRHEPDAQQVAPVAHPLEEESRLTTAREVQDGASNARLRCFRLACLQLFLSMVIGMCTIHIPLATSISACAFTGPLALFIARRTWEESDVDKSCCSVRPSVLHRFLIGLCLFAMTLCVGAIATNSMWLARKENFTRQDVGGSVLGAVAAGLSTLVFAALSWSMWQLYCLLDLLRVRGRFPALPAREIDLTLTPPLCAVPLATTAATEGSEVFACEGVPVASAMPNVPQDW